MRDKHDLENILLISDLEINLFSITKKFLNRALLRNKRNVLIFNYPDGIQIRFDYIIKTKKRYLACIIFRPIGICEKKDKINLKRINRQTFHNISTYQYIQSLNKTARGLDYKLTDKMNKCIQCARAKAKKLKISKKGLRGDRCSRI